MRRYVLRRLLQTIPILWGVATLVFAMLYLLPGDPVAAMLAQSGASAETVERVRQQLGLNDPLPVQYGRFLSNALRGDLGNSIFQNRPVVTLIAEQLPVFVPGPSIHPYSANGDPAPIMNTIQLRRNPFGRSTFVPPFEIATGKCAVLRDPWAHSLVILDHTRGRLLTDEDHRVFIGPDGGAQAQSTR